MAGRSGEAWNDEDMSTLQTMFRDGRTNDEIARVLERTSAAVGAQISKMRRRRLLGFSNSDDD